MLSLWRKCFCDMIVIADSSSTRTEWVLVDGTQVVEHAFTAGLNPYFQSRRDLSHAIRLELPESFLRRRRDHVYFYGAGCASAEKKKIMELSLTAQFRSPVTVESDLLGAARGLLVHSPGLACIIGTGSNSCLYDGEKIIRNVPPLGYVLGDEGSGAFLGKRLLADVLKGIAPQNIIDAFIAHFGLDLHALMDSVYSAPMPSRILAQYAAFLPDHMDDIYIYRLIYSSFEAFFERNVAAYDYSGGISVVGSTAVQLEPILRKSAADFGIVINKVVANSMPGLIEYHRQSND